MSFFFFVFLFFFFQASEGKREASEERQTCATGKGVPELVFLAAVFSGCHVTLPQFFWGSVACHPKNGYEGDYTCLRSPEEDKNITPAVQAITPGPRLKVKFMKKKKAHWQEGKALSVKAK